MPQEEWEAEFARYKQTPEYIKTNQVGEAGGAVVPAWLSRAVCRLTASSSDLVQTERDVLCSRTESRAAAALAPTSACPLPSRLLQGMTVEEFKFIYFWEWGHRMWGRALGEGRGRGV